MAWSNTPSRTGTSEWRRVKRWARDNLDYRCNAIGCEESANLELDHITPHYLGGTEAPGNLQWLCPTHHKQKTAGEAYRARGGRYRRKEQPSIGSVTKGRGITPARREQPPTT